jgi:peptide/nickel transport system permease protein
MMKRPALLRNVSFVMGLCVLVPVLVCAVAPGLLAPYSPNVTVAAPLLHPSVSHLLGTDEVGRDILSRLIWAARTDVGISLSAAALAFCVGTPVGLFAGYRGGATDVTIMRATDVLLAFPSILLAIFVIAVFGHGYPVLIGALALMFVASWSRLARGLAVQLRVRGYVEGAEVSGAHTWHIIRWHLLPNARGPLLVGLAMTASYALVSGATLSYLGLGVQPPTASWGVMLQSSFDYVFVDPLYGVLPGACVTLVALAYTWIADGFDEVVGGHGARRIFVLPVRRASVSSGLLDADDEAELA